MIQAPVAETASMDALRWAVIAIEVLAIVATAAWLVRRARRAVREGGAAPDHAASPRLPAANRAARRNATPRGGTVRVATPTASPALPRAGDVTARGAHPGVGLANAASRDPGMHLSFDDATPAVHNDTLHCPRCGAVVRAHVGETPLVARCVSCGRRVAARRDGTRLVVTVDGAA